VEIVTDFEKENKTKLFVSFSELDLLKKTNAIRSFLQGKKQTNKQTRINVIQNITPTAYYINETSVADVKKNMTENQEQHM